MCQPGAPLLTAESTFTSTREPPRLNRVPPPTPASASPHLTVPTRTAPHPTTRPASVVLLDVLQVQDYIVPSQATPVVLFHRVLKPMVLLQTAQRVFVVPRHAQQIQVYIVPSRATNVVLFHHALKPMALLRTAQHVSVALHRALQV